MDEINWKDCQELYEDLLIFDGFDKAIIGIAKRFNQNVIVYDTNTIL